MTTGMSSQDAERQIAQMIEFIKQEAKEKAEVRHRVAARCACELGRPPARARARAWTRA
jgi:hypothetical protein